MTSRFASVGDVFDLVVEIHVPVNAGADAERRAAAADEQRHRRGGLRVLLVVRVFTEHAHLVAVELFGPVAVLAGEPRRPHRLHRRRHRLRHVAASPICHSWRVPAIFDSTSAPTPGRRGTPRTRTRACGPL